MKNVIGLDFGTTNTVVAVSNGEHTTSVTFSQGDALVDSTPTVLFFEDNTSRVLIGEDATLAYVDDPDNGRYLRSIKSTLSSRTFEYTIINGKQMNAEDLVYTFLTLLKRRMLKDSRVDIEKIVLGHPVKFSNDPEMHEIAKARLTNAAARAGFSSITLCAEPVGALYAYAHKLKVNDRQKILVCDIGGGTSDFTLATIMPSGAIEVAGVAGTRLGGDDFDSAIMWEKLAHLFGRNSTYKSMFGNVMPMPYAITYQLRRPHLIPLLRDRKTINTIIEIQHHSDNPKAIKRLLTLVQGNYGLQLFREIEQAKKNLTGTDSTLLRFEEDDFDVNTTLTRDEFEAYTLHVIDGIISELEKFLDEHDLIPDEIDHVFVTGGTSYVPAFQRRLKDLFPGAGKVVIGNAFASVAHGLAIYGARNS